MVTVREKNLKRLVDEVGRVTFCCFWFDGIIISYIITTFLVMYQVLYCLLFSLRLMAWHGD